MEEFNDFLIEWLSGPTGQAFINLMDDKPARNAFFKPYESPSNFCLRAVNVVTGLVAGVLLAIEAALACIFYAGSAIVDLCMGDTNKATKSIETAVISFFAIGVALIGAAISPLINLIDLLGGAVETIIEQCDEQTYYDKGFGAF